MMWELAAGCLHMRLSIHYVEEGNTEFTPMKDNNNDCGKAGAICE